MNLVYLCLQPLSGHGATDAHVTGIVGGLRASGQNVHVVATTVTGRSLLRRLVEGLRLQMAAILRMRQADAGYVRMHPVAAFTALLVRDTPIVVEVNGVPEDFYVAHPSLRRFARLLEWLLRYQLRRATHVVTVTDGLKDWVNGAEPRARSVHVVPNAADAQVFRPGLNRPSDVPAQYVLFFGALSPWQGIDLAVAAASHPAWPTKLPLVVIGDGQEVRRVLDAVDTMPSQVQYLGSRSREAVAPYVSNALATIVPKRYHAQRAGQSPLKLYESLAAGVPVIATPLAGATDIDSLRSAIITINPEPEAVANAVATIANDPSAARKAGSTGRQAVLRSHTWKHRADLVLALLESAPSSTGD